jgi:hypothetical protein
MRCLLHHQGTEKPGTDNAEAQRRRDAEPPTHPVNAKAPIREGAKPTELRSNSFAPLRLGVLALKRRCFRVSAPPRLCVFSAGSGQRLRVFEPSWLLRGWAAENPKSEIRNPKFSVS